MQQIGKSDPRTVVPLLWRERGTATPIGRTGLTIDAIVTAAVVHADAHGLGDFSMRTLAKRLGVGAMSLYTHIPGKDELLDLMVDEVLGETADPLATGNGWRAEAEALATRHLGMLLRHPWMVYLVETRPIIGPNTVATWDAWLRPFDGLGLSDVAMDRIVSLLSGFVLAHARREVALADIESATGESLDTWWYGNEHVFAAISGWERYPVASRVGNAVQEGDLDPRKLREAFHDGLATLLDGVAVRIAKGDGGG